MGTFVTNLHVQDADRNAVIDALRSLDAVPVYVRDSLESKWISVFPEPADQDEIALSKMAASLSSALNRPVIAFIIHDIPRSRENPKIFRIDDTKIVGDRIAEFRPSAGNIFA